MDYNISLIPDQKTEQILIRLSHNINQEIGSTFKLTKTSALPHLTLYLAGFPDKNIPQISARLSKICSNHREIHIRIKGWVMTSEGLIMLNCILTNDLTALHKDVIAELNDLREQSIADVWLNSLTKFNEPQANMLEQIGFPYALELWSPHFSIAKINPQLIDRIEPAISELNLSFVGRTVALGLSGEGGVFKSLLLSYELQTLQAA